MRGTQSSCHWQRTVTRIIPADAGNTYMNQTTENTYEDHPRGCGEHKSVMKCAETLLGSSPRMRGTLVTGL
ncbi:hypothetical protein BAST_1427 [Bifidobacterium asteroides PRL2011]|nr:hypothetical protein BAST_1427 [Bifidobacterium asteroides PRL2011]